MKILIKISNVFTRKSISRKNIAVFLTFKKIFYKWFFSDNWPSIKGSKIVQPTQFVGSGKIQIEGAQLGVWPSPNLLSSVGYIEARSTTANVIVKEKTFINNSFVIIADKKSILIGSRCLIGPNFFACDSDFHGVEIKDRINGNYNCGDVIIEDDVFIGEDVKVLKGVRIGAGSVIGSGSLVSCNVDAHSVYAGVPAKKLKNI